MDFTQLYEAFDALEDPDRLLLLEQWADEAALAAHQAGAGIAALREVKDRYVLATEIRRY